MNCGLDILNLDPYTLDKKQKEEQLTRHLLELTAHHRQKCPEYRRYLKAWNFHEEEVHSYYDLPFIPVNLFKELSLKSIPDTEIFKTMTSSGTTGQQVSKIYLDRETAGNQQKVLVKIVSHLLGKSRMPMLIIDSPAVIKNRAMFSARGAGILGFSIFGIDKTYALDDEMHLNLPEIKEFLTRHASERILLFGFTFMIWQHFYWELKKQNEKLDLSNAVLIHGGGWKKLLHESVSPEQFKKDLYDLCGISHVHDYYGMVEQTGCIYVECEYGHLHASVFSDVVMRRPQDFSVCDIGETGIVQVLSTLPYSYPGHSLLTEDEGIILGEDDCPCGRKGKYFKILGRLKDAEIRGCSDTYAAKY